MLVQEISEPFIKKSYLISFSSLILAISTIIPFYESLNGNSVFYLLKYVCFLVFILVLTLGKMQFKIDSTTLLLIVSITFLGIFSFFNVVPSAIVTTLLYLLIGLAIAFSSEVIFKNIQLETFYKILWSFLIAIFIFVLVPSLVESTSPLAYYTSTEGRYRFVGNFHNSNELARFCLLGLLIGLRLLNIKKKTSKQIFLWATILSSAYVIYLTNSRTSVAIAGAGVVVYSFIRMYLKSKRVTLVATYFSILTILVMLLPNIYKFFSFYGFRGMNQLLSGRLSTWAPIFNQDTIDLLLGTGTIREGLAASTVLVNGYIEIISYLGLVGLMFWLLFIGNMFIKKIVSSFKANSIGDIFGVAVIVLILVYYFFEGGLLSIGNVFSIYFWIELAQRKIKNTSIIKETKEKNKKRKLRLKLK